MKGKQVDGLDGAEDVWELKLMLKLEAEAEAALRVNYKLNHKTQVTAHRAEI